MERVESMQSDQALAPLNNFLFKCEFSPSEVDIARGNRLFSYSVLKKMNYSVKDIKLPKMKAESVEHIQYGSFFVSFPFFATGDKEMTITFYETDDMMLSKIFYALQAQNRWRPSTIFRDTQAQLFVDVVIYDQRSTLSAKEHELYRNRYGLLFKYLDQPKFDRSNDADLCTITAHFNTIEGEYASGNWDGLRKSLLHSDFNAVNEMKTGDGKNGGLDTEADNAAVSLKDIEDRFTAWLGEREAAKNGEHSDGNGHEYETIIRTQDKDLRRFSEELGDDNRKRMQYLAEHPEKIKELRKLLISKGVKVNDDFSLDDSDLVDALYSMGIIGGSSIAGGYCQQGVSVVDAIKYDKPIVKAETASKSVDAWLKSARYNEAKNLERKIKSVDEANKYIQELIDKKELEEGDMVIIDYPDKDGKEQPGHIFRMLFREKRNEKGQEGWGAAADYLHVNYSGLGGKHGVTRIRVIKKALRDNESPLVHKSVPGSKPE